VATTNNDRVVISFVQTGGDFPDPGLVPVFNRLPCSQQTAAFTIPQESHSLIHDCRAHRNARGRHSLANGSGALASGPGIPALRRNAVRRLLHALDIFIQRVVDKFSGGAGHADRGLLTLHYSNLELVVVSDGSTDRTMDILRQEFELEPFHTIYWKRIDTAPVVALYRSHTFPNLLVVDKENGGKADALNAALNMATSRLVCTIDADTVIEPDALQRMVRPFLERPDLVAAGGTIRPINASRVSSGRVDEVLVPGSFLPGMQVIECLRAFLFGRMGWTRLGGNLIISGTFGLFDRHAVVATGSYAQDTVGEDMELILRMRCAGYELGGPRRVAFIPDPVAWTEVPECLRVLGRQRDRWHRGLADALWRLRGLFNYLRRHTDWGEMERRGFEPVPPVSPGAPVGETEGAR